MYCVCKRLEMRECENLSSGLAVSCCLLPDTRLDFSAVFRVGSWSLELCLWLILSPSGLEGGRG